MGNAGIAILIFAIMLLGAVGNAAGKDVSLQNTDYMSLPAGDNLLSEAPAGALEKAAKELYLATGGTKLKVSSTTRTLEEQAALFYDNCLKNNGVCSPPTCDIAKDPAVLYRNSNGKYLLNGSLAGKTDRADIIKGLAGKGKETNCPHTSKLAVDAWCEGCSDYQCSPACQEILTQKMLDSGFCRLNAEAWHFEWNERKVSSNCHADANSSYVANGAEVDPKKGGCVLWDYLKSKCVEYRKSGNGNATGNVTGAGTVPKACYDICGVGFWLDGIVNVLTKPAGKTPGSEAGGIGGGCVGLCAGVMGGGEEAVANKTVNPPPPIPDNFCKTARCKWWEACDNAAKSCIAKKGFENRTYECPPGYSLGKDGYCHPQSGGGNRNGGSDGWGKIKIGPDGTVIYPGNQQCLSYKSCSDCTKAAQASSGLSGCKWFPDSGTCIDMEGGIDSPGSCDNGKAGAGGKNNSGTGGGAGKKTTGTGGESKKYYCPTGYVLDKYNLCHEECGQGGYCEGDAVCTNGECLSCPAGDSLGADGMCRSNIGGSECPQGYVLGEDDFCHSECGENTYCTGDSVCYNGECLSCSPGEYMGTDGMCYLGNGEPNSCPQGYVPGDDEYCHLECGANTYCTGDSQCYNGQCLSCAAGEYLGTDGNCYPEDGGQELTCDDPGYVLGEDYLCHPACGSNTYCTGDSQCFNGQCLTCDAGYYLGTDGNCYSGDGGGTTCPQGYVPGDDGYCHPEGGECNSGYILGNDDLCHPECGSNTYCTGDAECYNGECLSCAAGEYLGTDGQCHSEGGGCNSGYVLGNDNLCHPECGDNTYCTGDAECVNGECISCNPGYYLGNDGQCHSENPCNSGYILGNDNLCHPACGSDTYCTGDSQCFNGECISCNPGYYLGNDGNCHSEGGECNSGYILGNDNLCHPACGSDFYCTGGSICYYGQCLSCPGGEYLGTDGNCYSYG